MAFHISNLGMFGNDVVQYADQAGFVPQFGDTPEQFVYESNFDDNYDWTTWVAEAVEATAEAEQCLRDWLREEAEKDWSRGRGGECLNG